MKVTQRHMCLGKACAGMDDDTYTLHLCNSLPSFQTLGDSFPHASTIVYCLRITLGRGLGKSLSFGASRTF